MPVHVLVDKPLAVGFNRRFAPAYAPLALLDRSVVLMQKNRVGIPDEPHRVVVLAEVWRHDAGEPEGVRLVRRGDWTPVSTQRGFTAMCAAFLEAVHAGRIVSVRRPSHPRNLRGRRARRGGCLRAALIRR